MTIFKGSKYEYFVVLTANITAFMAGAAIAWSSPMIAILEGDDMSQIPLGRKITEDEASLIGSLPAVGGLLSPLIFGYLFQVVGRKWTLTVLMVPFFIAFIIAAFAKTIWLYYIVRVLAGMGSSGVLSTVIVYVTEVSEPVNRGLLGTSTNGFNTLGFLFAYAVGPYTSIMVFNLILAAFSFIYFPLFIYMAPESPIFHVMKNDETAALKSLNYLRRKSSKEHLAELDEIKVHVEDMKAGKFMDLFTDKVNRKALLYGLALTNLQQFSGFLVFTVYAQNIFNATGSNIPAEVSPIIVSSVQVATSLICPLFSDIFGRRKLYLFSIPGAALAELVLGVYFYLKDDGQDVSALGWLPVLSMVIFILFYNTAMGPLPWVIMSELLPSNIVSKASAVATVVFWIPSFFLTRYFADLSNAISMAGSFWLFTGFDILYWLFVFFFLFETKGKTLKEIQDILNK